MKITGDMKVRDILNIDDEMETIFEQHGLLCCGCPGAAEETLREAADGHDIDITALLRDLNKEA